jgi:beta-phosphoglucomutase-like phosphatase (HAD superfamily)
MRYLKVRAILFDMDGTLIDSTEASEITWQRWAVAHQVSMESIRRVHHGRRPEETIAIVAPYLNAIEESKHIYAEQEMLAEGIQPIAGANSFFESIPRGQCAIVTAASRAIVDLRFRTVGLVPPDVCVTGDTLKVGSRALKGILKQRDDWNAGPRTVLCLKTHQVLNPEIVPRAFLQDFRGITYLDGILRLAE